MTRINSWGHYDLLNFLIRLFSATLKFLVRWFLIFKRPCHCLSCMDFFFECSVHDWRKQNAVSNKINRSFPQKKLVSWIKGERKSVPQICKHVFIDRKKRCRSLSFAKKVEKTTCKGKFTNLKPCFRPKHQNHALFKNNCFFFNRQRFCFLMNDNHSNQLPN